MVEALGSDPALGREIGREAMEAVLLMFANE
jgi:hypothetical protein